MLIMLKEIYKNYGRGDSLTKALKGLSLEVEEGEMIAIMGKSGSGKTTLLNVLGALDTIDQGEYYFNGQRLVFRNQDQMAKFRRNKIGIIVQGFALINHKTVFDNVALPLRYNKIKNNAVRKAVMNSLEELGIAEKAAKYPYELSGGQCQRVAIARSLINNPDVLLADEPTGSLDSKTEDDIMQILGFLNNQGKTIILVTHDSRIAEQCVRTIHISDGQNVI